MDINEFVKQATAEGVTPEAIKALGQKLIDNTTGSIMSSIDNTIFTITGQKKPDLTKTIDFVATFAKKATSFDQEKTGYEKKIQELSAANPKVDELKKDYEGKISEMSNQMARQKMFSALEKSTLGMKVSDAYKDAFADVLDAKIQRLIANVVEKDGKFVLKNADGSIKIGDNGMAVEAADVLRKELAPFEATPQAPTAPPRVGAPTNNYQSMSTKDLANLAIQKGIDLSTKEGVEALSKFIAPPTA